MPRKSYREHRAERTAALSDDGTDLDSLASFSTLASHTTLASQATGTYPSFASFGLNGANNSSQPSPYYYPSTQSHLAPPSLRQRTYSNISSVSKRDATVDNVSIPASPTASSRILSPSPSDVPTPSGLPPSPAPPPSRNVSGEDVYPKPREKSKEDRDRDRRRRRERNEERWRRARAREAAHDAPVRRAAKVANSFVGAAGTQATAFLSAIAIRVVLTVAMLWVDDRSRLSIAHEVRGMQRTCAGRVAPALRPLMPACRAVFGSPVEGGAVADGVWPGTRAAAAIIIMRLVTESLLWSAAVMWSTVEGWREGRTLRTKVAAIIYLVLAPVLAIREAALLPVRGALGFAAWALVATTSGYDLAAAALMTAAAWFESSTRAYIPAFAVYALGKHIWLGRRSRGYLGRLAVVIGATLFALGVMEPVPLRERARLLVAAARAAGSAGCFKLVFRAIRSVISIRNALCAIALLPTAYLTLKSSYALRPTDNENVAPHAVPATARLLPIALTATAGALSLWPADPALPLLPLAFASALRRDDDEWAVAVQMHHVSAMSLWPALSGPLLSLAGGYVLGWNMLIGARQDAPAPLLLIHQKATFVLNFLANICPLFSHLTLGKVDWSAAGKYLGYAHRGFIVLSVAAVVVWANMRLVKTAWAVGAL